MNTYDAINNKNKLYVPSSYLNKTELHSCSAYVTDVDLLIDSNYIRCFARIEAQMKMVHFLLITVYSECSTICCE